MTSVTNGEVAPVALFVFNRPNLTTQVFERIRAAGPRRLLIVADGPRATRPEDVQLCEATRRIVTSPDWGCDLLTHFADVNLGCRHRMSSGLDWVFEQCSEAIILEDDCLPHSSFFHFCSEMLSHYREDSRIMHVSGDNFQGGRRRGDGSYFFSRYSLSWGWASWRRAWRYFDLTIPSWPLARKERWLESILENPLELKYWTNIFDRVHRGEMDAWDYQWQFTCWSQSGLSIQPNDNLVSNIGVGPDSTHFKQGPNNMIGIPVRELGKVVHPSAMVANREADRYSFQEHIAKSKRLRSRIARFLAVRTKRLLLSSPSNDVKPRTLKGGVADHRGASVEPSNISVRSRSPAAHS
jgi:hypothetical protein